MAILNLSPDEQKTAAQLPTPEQVIQTSQKTCPKCAERIQLDALVCRFCGHQFSEAEVENVKRQIEEEAREAKRLAEERDHEASRLADDKAAQRKIETKKKSRHNWGWVLSIGGGLLALASGLLFIILISSSFIGDTASSEAPVTIYTYLCCPLPLLLLGVSLLFSGIKLIRSTNGTIGDSTEHLINE